MCAPTSTQRLAQRSCQSARPSSGLLPWLWLAKSITEVVPPNAAAMVPVPKVSTVRAVPNSQSRCVCTSTAPGMTRSPLASCTSRPPPAGRSRPMVATLPPSTRMSPSYSPSAVTIRPPLISVAMFASPMCRPGDYGAARPR